MIIAGAKCDKCGRIETINYTSEAALTVLLRQKGWVLEDKKSICRVCNIETDNKKSK